MADKKLRKIAAESMDIDKYEFIPNSKDLMIHFGIDYNKDGTYADNIEPSSVRKYNYDSDVLEK